MNIFVPLLGLVFVLYFMETTMSLSKPTVESLRSLTTALGVGLICLLASLFLLVEDGYLSTFLSIETGKQSFRRRFLEGDDHTKSVAFLRHISYWMPIKDKV